ncbi:MAG TPA: hypothetical protein VHQ66_12100 [Myxococcota bacterium]|nr:hypothetical protein [Myxococcota bacterium]
MTGPAQGDDQRAERLALNEALARAVNESVDAVASSWFDPDELVEFHCECVRVSCADRIPLTRAEYAAVRADARTFVVRPAHESADVEEVVAHIREFPVVRKIGLGAQVAEATDPRSPGS